MTRNLKTDEVTRLLAKLRRDELHGLGLCINSRAHGAATHGVRCERCADVHRKSA